MLKTAPIALPASAAMATRVRHGGRYMAGTVHLQGWDQGHADTGPGLADTGPDYVITSRVQTQDSINRVQTQDSINRVQARVPINRVQTRVPINRVLIPTSSWAISATLSIMTRLGHNRTLGVD